MPARPRQSFVWQALFVWIVFVLCAGTFGGLSDGRILGNDAIPYAVELSAGAPHANPHHLLFHPLSRGVLALLAPFGHASFPLRSPLGLAMTAQVLVSALGAALAALFFLRAARRALGAGWRAEISAVALTLMLVFSAGHWLYAAVGETYLPAIAAETALLGLALRERLHRASAPRTVWLVVALLAAVLLRQDSVLVVLPLLLLLPAGRALRVIGGAGLLALGIYALAWGLGAGEASFWDWLRGLATTGLWGAPVSARGFAVAGSLTLTALAYPVWYAGQASMRGELGGAQTALFLGLAPWILCVLAPMLTRPFEDAERPADDDAQLNDRRRAVLALLAFAAVRFGFFAWWQPGNMEYHTGTLTPLALALAVWLGGRRVSLRSAVALASAMVLVLVGNLRYLIAPNQAADLHARATEALAAAGPGGLVLSLDRLGHYALLRAHGTQLGPELPRLLDASDVAGGLDLTSLTELRAAIQATLSRGARVVAARDLLLPARFEHAPWPLDWSDAEHVGGMNQLIEGFQAGPADPEAGLDAWLWTLR